MASANFFDIPLGSKITQNLLKNMFFEKDEAELLGKSGTLEIRLARSKKDIKKAQKLRYQIFYNELSAIPDLNCRLKRRDIDHYDQFCDHLLVIETAPSEKSSQSNLSLVKKSRVVGTYRLLRQDVARLHGGFYSEQEFNLRPLMEKYKDMRFLELGRSCVDPVYRDKRTIELLWHGIWAYVKKFNIDAMFGCASFTGTDVKKYAMPLSFLYHHCQCDDEWKIRAAQERRVSMNILASEQVELKAAMQDMPPLIKGYLRVGAKFGAEAVIDHQFRTIDVMVLLKVSDINSKYINYFGSDGHRYAA